MMRGVATAHSGPDVVKVLPRAVAALFVAFALASVTVTEARAADDTYCVGARYKLGAPFLDLTKVRPHKLTDFGLDPIVRIDRVQRFDGNAEQTIAYAYYNRAGLAELAPVPWGDMTGADRDAFVAMTARIGVALLSSTIAPPPTFGNGFILFFAGKKMNKALNGELKLAECEKLPRD